MGPLRFTFITSFKSLRSVIGPRWRRWLIAARHLALLPKWFSIQIGKNRLGVRNPQPCSKQTPTAWTNRRRGGSDFSDFIVQATAHRTLSVLPHLLPIPNNISIRAGS